MRYVRVNGHFAYQSKGNRLEVIEPGSVVMMEDKMADSFIARGLGSECEGPELLIRPDKGGVERPGLDARPARAEQAVARPQQARTA